MAKHRAANLEAARAYEAAYRRNRRLRVCRGCSLPSGRYSWCMTCRLLGKHLLPERTSVCSLCGDVVPVRNRKYCDDCWTKTMRALRGTPRRTDANQAEIVAALRQIGCDVMDLSHVGRGVPDILVAPSDNQMFLMEIKTAKGKLNKRQIQWMARWQGPKVYIVHSIDEALAAVREFNAGVK